MSKLENKIYDFILKQDVKIEYDVFSYGYSTVKTYFFFLIFVIPICIYTNMIIETLLFLLVYISLRKNLGGFHFNNQIICFIISVFISILVPLLSNKIGEISIIVRITIVILSYIIINKIGVVDHKNKKLNEKEKEFYFKRVNSILFIYYSFIVIIYPLVNYNYGNVIILTLILIDFNLIIPKLINYIFR